MTRPDADRRPEATLAEGFARHVRQWALAQGADAATALACAEAARALSLAASAGHVCIGLAALAEPGAAGGVHGVAGWRALLQASGVVGTPVAPRGRPLILDDDDRLYLHRDFDFEQRLARRLVRCAAPLPPGDAAQRARTAAQLATLFAGNATDGAPDWQQLAAALALRGRLTLISGGPGTGKTTTVVNLLACLLELQPDARIVLAAPTGKAAARLAEALRGRAGHLPPALRARLPSDALTVHRLLGVRPDGDGEGPFRHDAEHPLALDVLVVDEASMLDLALATRLLEAVPEAARIVLLGDKDQLAAVESGAVFAELSTDPSLSEAARADLAALCGVPAARIVPAAARAPSALHDSVVWFDRNFRFAADSGIGRLAADTVAGRAEAVLAWLHEGADDSVRWLDDAQPLPAPATLQALIDGYAPYLAALREALHDPGRADPAAVAAAFNRFRVLCALREGPRGVLAVNERLGRQMRQAMDPGADARSPWYVGRPVMVLRNDATLRLFNGDIGITLPDADGRLMVQFATADGGFRAVAPLRLPQHQTALAMTVHKAQGSEFEAVAVLLPAQRSRVLSRELLYTAITRARRQLLLAAPAAVLAAAIEAGTQRHSGLLARLREAAAS
jgi:exodeoxyribonuclease V alpha subunit